MDTLISIFLGIGLAASAGLRLFLPMLIANVASTLGWISFTENFAWMGSWISFIVFLTATLVEISAYYIPWLDNALDSIAIPLSAIAGTLLSVSFITDLNPVISWTLGIIAGGGTAALVKSASGTFRIGSSTTTAGAGNWIISSLENLASFIMSVVSVLLPLIAGIIVILVLTFTLKKFLYKRQTDKQSN